MEIYFTYGVPPEAEQKEDGGAAEDFDKSDSLRRFTLLNRLQGHRDADTHDPHKPANKM